MKKTWKQCRGLDLEKCSCWGNPASAMPDSDFRLSIENFVGELSMVPNNWVVSLIWLRVAIQPLLHKVLDCKTVGFLSKSVKKSVKRGVRVLRARSARASYAGRACEAREKKSLPSLALCFQPRSRPFFWLLARTWIRKNKDCFAVYKV